MANLPGTAAQQNQQDSNLPEESAGKTSFKEGEPNRAEEAKLVTEIKSVSESLDAEALNKVRESLPDAESRFEEPYIPASVSKSGVVSRESEANEVIRQGTTITLPIDEETYKRGVGTKKPNNSLFALTLWIGRVVKLAHKKALKVIFRKV